MHPFVTEEECDIVECVNDRLRHDRACPLTADGGIRACVHFVRVSFPSAQFLDDIGADPAAEELGRAADAEGMSVVMIWVETDFL